MILPVSHSETRKISKNLAGPSFQSPAILYDQQVQLQVNVTIHLSVLLYIDENIR